MSELPRLPAVVDGDALRAPRPGWFRCTVADQQLIAPDAIIGELDVLGRTSLIIAPNIGGIADMRDTRDPMRGESATAPSPRRAVGYGDVLLRVVADSTRPATEAGSASPQPQPTDHGLVFRAPTAGRFYARPAPDKPVFVSTGAELVPGTVVCLLEVMKTFSRVTYSGAPARVRAVLVCDGADVKAGDPLLELEPA